MLLKDNRTGKKAVYDTFLEVEEGNLKTRFIFTAKNSKKYCPYGAYNENLYEGDVCEVFIGKQSEYYELEVSPKGTGFFALIKNEGSGKFFLKEKLPAIGVCFYSEETADGYKAVIETENKLIYSLCGGEPVRFNAFRIDTDGGDLPEKHLFALNPTLSGTFHKSESFIRLHNIK